MPCEGAPVNSVPKYECALPLSPISNNIEREIFPNVNEENEEKTEETTLPKIRRKPNEPTKSEREAHEVCHLPFRSWCRHCVKARGKNWPHINPNDRKLPG